MPRSILPTRGIKTESRMRQEWRLCYSIRSSSLLRYSKHRAAHFALIILQNIYEIVKNEQDSIINKFTHDLAKLFN